MNETKNPNEMINRINKIKNKNKIVQQINGKKK